MIILQPISCNVLNLLAPSISISSLSYCPTITGFNKCLLFEILSKIFLSLFASVVSCNLISLIFRISILKNLLCNLSLFANMTYNIIYSISYHQYQTNMLLMQFLPTFRFFPVSSILLSGSLSTSISISCLLGRGCIIIAVFFINLKMFLC